ncbi:DUF547 domain-containing protein [Spongiivirga citrea]|uniref:DUF547 domain-containing protein n=1 Tax=Spongiivirga citrea TaxID=1481457 RepID=A0A6M0CWS1_9FLAO|nr:DUF547 domain-containing protein [Spongiivirga citrea]NER18180.1 DUF547 domain-containing protein [Spongiivirga citrea]
MKLYKLLIIGMLVSTTGIAQNTDAFFTKADTFFGKHVTNGKVNYKAIKADPADLNELVELAKGITVSKSDAKTYQAFWINGYNLSVINGIIKKYPTKSPLNINGFFDKTKHDIGGKQITLNDIENKLLRGNFKSEPRFHFVLVCAGLGCPPIINEAYTPAKLEAQLQRQTEIALNNPSFIKVKGKKVQISQIFEWYKGDFTQNGSEVDYINKFRKEPIDTKARISYYPYDWKLNDTK